MKTLSTWFTLTILAGMMLVPQFAAAQDPERPHQIGLIDMGHIFQNYEKFKHQTERLQEQANAAQQKVEAEMEKLKVIQAKLNELTPGTPEYTRLESDGIKIQNELQTVRAIEQREIIRKQAELYKQIYLEVQRAVGMYARHYHYTLIIRFDRGEVKDAGKPDEIVRNMNRQVVYYQPQDDLTDPILSFLNDEYRKSLGQASSGTPTQR